MFAFVFCFFPGFFSFFGECCHALAVKLQKDFMFYGFTCVSLPFPYFHLNSSCSSFLLFRKTLQRALCVFAPWWRMCHICVSTLMLTQCIPNFTWERNNERTKKHHVVSWKTIFINNRSSPTLFLNCVQANDSEGMQLKYLICVLSKQHFMHFQALQRLAVQYQKRDWQRGNTDAIISR